MPALALGLLGVRRAVQQGWRRPGSGFARSSAGLALALAWLTVAVYLAPHVIRASDPGCATYKGQALTSYSRVVADFNRGAGPTTDVHDLSRAMAAINRAAAASSSTQASHALARLGRKLAAVRARLTAQRPVARPLLMAVNRAASAADAACGTVRVFP